MERLAYNIQLYLLIAAVVVGVLWLSGCASVGATPDGISQRVSVERSPYAPGQVAWRNARGNWEILPPPPLKFTGRTITGNEIQEWAKGQGILARGVFGDTTYAQLESKSAIAAILWLKAFQRDVGYTYIGEPRDCEDFATLARAFRAFFADSAPASPLVFGIWAHMAQPFAGVSDGYHALNVAWTDAGVPVFEPQGINLVHQDIRAWPNLRGLDRFFTD